jgi:hypothetical protein
MAPVWALRPPRAFPCEMPTIGEPLGRGNAVQDCRWVGEHRSYTGDVHPNEHGVAAGRLTAGSCRLAVLLSAGETATDVRGVLSSKARGPGWLPRRYVSEKDLAFFKYHAEEGGPCEGASEWEVMLDRELPGVLRYTAWRRTLPRCVAWSVSSGVAAVGVWRGCWQVWQCGQRDGDATWRGATASRHQGMGRWR